LVEAFLDVVFGVAAFLGLVIASGYIWQWVYMRPTNQDETCYFSARDGWRLAIHHYVPLNKPEGNPVILCHGLGANRFTFDLPGGPSLARYLRDQGRDVWVAELRGAGMSDCPGLFVSDVPRVWDFDDHLHADLPAIMDFVLARTGSSKIHFVGHSMGGLLILAHLAAHKNAPVASAGAIGSPVDFSRVRNANFDFLLKVRPLIAGCSVSPIPFIGRVVTPFAQWMSNFLLGVFHPANVHPQTARKVVALGAELGASNKLWLTFGRYLETGRFSDPDGRPYLTNLPESQIPLLILGGSKDLMAPEQAVLAACDAAGTRPGRCECLIFGKASGCAEDYGHMDLLVGKHVEQEVFPVILKAMREHDTP
jgi:pimeloyl-ACP methyl ester carboxylesterase